MNWSMIWMGIGVLEVGIGIFSLLITSSVGEYYDTKIEFLLDVLKFFGKANMYILFFAFLITGITLIVLGISLKE